MPTEQSPRTPDHRRADQQPGGASALARAGRSAWALLGILALVVGALYLAGQLTLVVVPLILALFPAALLAPVAGWLKSKGVPAALAALLTILGTLAVIAGVFAALIPVVVAQMPQLIEAGQSGLGQLRQWLQDDPLGLGIEGPEQLLQQAQDLVGQAGEYTGQALSALATAVEVVVGLLFLFVVLFFYLKDSGRIARGIGDLLPTRWRADSSALAERVWATLGNYFRGQLLVALTDAVFIGAGLLILGVPLALPLAALIFFGALFPIVGAVTTGALAVLVALADGGLVTALIVLGLILVVQQLEGNVLQPVILGRTIDLHPLVVLVAITIGGTTIGILGAFLAVPVAASIARVVEYVRERSANEAGPGASATVQDTAATGKDPAVRRSVEDDTARV